MKLRSLAVGGLVLGMAGMVSTARAEFEVEQPRQERAYAITRPTVVCKDSAAALNEELAKLQTGTFKLSSLASNLVVPFSASGWPSISAAISQVCVVVEPAAP